MTQPVRPPYIQKGFISKEEAAQIIAMASRTPFNYNALEPGRSEIALDKVSIDVLAHLVPVIKRVQRTIIGGLGGNAWEHHLDFGVVSKMLPGSYVVYHADNAKQVGYGWVPNHTAWRTYSACLYLSECHGGALRFPYLDVEVRIEPGTLLGFPSGKDYFHGAEPVVAGVRWGLILWFTKSTTYNMWDRLGVQNLTKEEVALADNS
jgi:hypothetical protein